MEYDRIWLKEKVIDHRFMDKIRKMGEKRMYEDLRRIKWNLNSWIFNGKMKGGVQDIWIYGQLRENRRKKKGMEYG